MSRRSFKTEVFGKPNEFWTPEMLRKSYEKKNRTFRRLWLKEMISKWLWLIKNFESREERISTEWQKFISSERPIIDTAEKLNLLKEMFEVYLTDDKFKQIIHKKTFWELANYPVVNISDIKKVWVDNLELLSDYSREYLTSASQEFNLVTR